MKPLKSEFEIALYTDEAGNVVGLDDVQLFENPPADRVATLQRALRTSNLEIRYRAALVLAAWGDDEGLTSIEWFVDNRIDEMGIVDPHRLYGYNNIYDKFAYAVQLYGDLGRQLHVQKRIYKKLLSLYGPCEFESRLKYALMQSGFDELVNDVEQACRRSLDLGKEYLASQLLPVLGKWNQSVAIPLMPTFVHEFITTPNPTANVVEALRFVEAGSRDPLLNKLAGHLDSVVAQEAKQLIAELQA